MHNALMALLLGVSLLFTHVAQAEVKTQHAREFVEELFEDFRDIFAEKSTNIDQAFIDYYGSHFDTRRLPKAILGNWSRRASKAQQEKFATLLPKFLCRQVGPHIEKYFSADDKTSKISVKGVKIVRKKFVQVDAEYSGLQKVDMRITLSSDKDSFRVVNVDIAKISLLLAQRDLVSQLIRDNGNDMEKFLTVLEEISTPACIEPAQG